MQRGLDAFCSTKFLLAKWPAFCFNETMRAHHCVASPYVLSASHFYKYAFSRRLSAVFPSTTFHRRTSFILNGFNAYFYYDPEIVYLLQNHASIAFNQNLDFIQCRFLASTLLNGFYTRLFSSFYWRCQDFFSLVCKTNQSLWTFV